MRRLSPLLLLVLLAGCGPVGNAGNEPVTLRITSALGTRQVDENDAVAKAGNHTVLGVLQANEPVTLDPQGHLKSIAGVAAAAGQRWAAYINGVEISKRIDEQKVVQGDRLWLDLQPRASVPNVPAAVGAFPAPFTEGYAGHRLPVRVECTEPGSQQCQEVGKRLGDVGVVVGFGGVGTSLSRDSIRVLVGVYSTLRTNEIAQQLERGPLQTGVLAEPAPDGKTITVLNLAGNPAKTYGSGTGLIAAIRYEGSQPTWIVTGTDAAGVDAAAGALQENFLAHHFALVIAGGAAVDVPTA